DLGNAELSGHLVPELGVLKNLQYLELYSNNITGPIPSNLVQPDELGELGSLLKQLHRRLNNNTLTGSIPMSLTNITTLQTSVDLLQVTHVLDLPRSLLRRLLFHLLQFPTPSGYGITGAIAGGVAAGAALLFAAPAIALCLVRRRKPHDIFFDVPAEEDPEVHLGQLKRFSLRELQVASDGFSNKNILGRGGFGKVYKGRLADGTLVAVKRLKEERTPGGSFTWLFIETLLRLRGFCMTPTERLLVYPYMANGSVASCLRERPPSQPPLDWPTPRGLSYLHDHCDPKIIHRDVKAANILLDKDFEAVVGDFGLAKLMDYKDTHVTTAVRGTIGHIAPEYLSTGKSSEKTDVFGYGIMLLELITGQRAFDLARLANDDDVMLLDWVKGLLKEKKLEMFVDPDLQTNYEERELEQVIQVALLCTQGSPMERPKMSEVVDAGRRWACGEVG
ncbi:hypothetical protein HID58_028196, partial [Brassica napus]